MVVRGGDALCQRQSSSCKSRLGLAGPRSSWAQGPGGSSFVAAIDRQRLRAWDVELEQVEREEEKPHGPNDRTLSHCIDR
jgi:hypothetical protein